MGDGIIPEIIASCHCKKVVFKIFELNPKFIVCHCGVCQLIHNGPWYGANCRDIKIIDGSEYINQSVKTHGLVCDEDPTNSTSQEVLNFCGECGSRLYYMLDDKLENNNYRYSVSIGLLHELQKDNLIMVAENYFDMKPEHYSFHETKKFSTGDLCNKKTEV